MPQIPKVICAGLGFLLELVYTVLSFHNLVPHFLSTAGAHEPTSERTQATTCEGTTQACQGTLVSSKRFPTLNDPPAGGQTA